MLCWYGVGTILVLICYQYHTNTPGVKLLDGYGIILVRICYQYHTNIPGVKEGKRACRVDFSSMIPGGFEICHTITREVNSGRVGCAEGKANLAIAPRQVRHACRLTESSSRWEGRQGKHTEAQNDR